MNGSVGDAECGGQVLITRACQYCVLVCVCGMNINNASLRIINGTLSHTQYGSYSTYKQILHTYSYGDSMSVCVGECACVLPVMSPFRSNSGYLFVICCCSSPGW